MTALLSTPCNDDSVGNAAPSVRLRKRSSLPLALIALLALTAGDCEEDNANAQCETLCQQILCGGVVTPENFAACEKSCVSDGKESHKQGDACEERLDGLIECINLLEDCGYVVEWLDTRLMAGDYPCKAETDEFAKACVGAWFEED